MAVNIRAVPKRIIVKNFIIFIFPAFILVFFKITAKEGTGKISSLVSGLNDMNTCRFWVKAKKQSMFQG